MSKRAFGLIEYRNLRTEHIPLSDLKARVASGELEWLEDYKRATPVLRAAPTPRNGISNKLRAPHKVKQWIWKDHFGYTRMRPLAVQGRQK